MAKEPVLKTAGLNCLEGSIPSPSAKRKPNTRCSICGTPIYRRPSDIKRLKNVYCSRACQGAPRKAAMLSKNCGSCGKSFDVPKYKAGRKFCSHACSNEARKGVRYSKGQAQSNSERRMKELREAFEFNSCMVKGCNYGRFLVVHRHVPGKDGGQYVIGNMFAICPNHHAEIHASLIEVEKISPCALRIVP